MTLKLLTILNASSRRFFWAGSVYLVGVKGGEQGATLFLGYRGVKLGGFFAHLPEKPLVLFAYSSVKCVALSHLREKAHEVLVELLVPCPLLFQPVHQLRLRS